MVAVERGPDIPGRRSEPLGVGIPEPLRHALAAVGDMRPTFVSAIREAIPSFPTRETIASAMQTGNDQEIHIFVGHTYVPHALEWARRFDPEFTISDETDLLPEGAPGEGERQFFTFYNAVYLLSRENAQQIVDTLPQA